MATEVLLPNDLLRERTRAPSSLRRHRNFPANGNLTNLVVNRRPYSNRKTSPKSDKSRSPDAKKWRDATADSRRKDDVNNGGIAMGQVTLLRRGESSDKLASKNKGGNGNPNPKKAARSPRNTGPESPQMRLKQIRLASPPPQPPSPSDVYAGSAFSLSPSPRSVPLPTFFSIKQQNELPCDDSATRDLRRLLRLD